jgi:MoaA/NifB/PqqE/SkfB family radical SAM enzyme
MPRIVIELTNRCNLRCQHCFDGRHGGREDLPLDVLGHILAEAQSNGFDHLSFTGGDPTVHREFAEILRLTCEAGYQFSFVTNGWNFVQVYPTVLPFRERLTVITFSLDGATQSTHDRVRGPGSYRRVMQALSVCVAEQLPFSINMVVTAHNRHELEPMARMAMQLGSRGVRFGHLMPSPLTTHQGFDLSPWDRKRVEAQIQELRDRLPIAIGMAPGVHTTDLFPCAPLQMQELNVDCRGNLTKCCHLSGHGGHVGQGDIIGSLKDEGFSALLQRLRSENEVFRRTKMAHLSSGEFADSDFFPCWYCSLHYKKVDWLASVPGSLWARLVRGTPGHQRDDANSEGTPRGE